MGEECRKSKEKVPQKRGIRPAVPTNRAPVLLYQHFTQSARTTKTRMAEKSIPWRHPKSERPDFQVINISRLEKRYIEIGDSWGQSNRKWRKSGLRLLIFAKEVLMRRVKSSHGAAKAGYERLAFGPLP